MTPEAKLRHHREIGVRLLINFIEATPETPPKIVDELVKRESEWTRELVPLAEPFGELPAGPLEPLTPMDPHEQLAVAHLAPLKDAKANLVRICHAVRMYRLGKLFQKFDPVTPGGKGGNQPKYDDIAIVAKARAILNSNGGNKAAASR